MERLKVCELWDIFFNKFLCLFFRQIVGQIHFDKFS